MESPYLWNARIPPKAAIKSSGGGVQRGNLFHEVPPLAAGGKKGRGRISAPGLFYRLVVA
jgi:hypothetical protein